jgi:hypothetical protein
VIQDYPLPADAIDELQHMHVLLTDATVAVGQH